MQNKTLTITLQIRYPKHGTDQLLQLVKEPGLQSHQTKTYNVWVTSHIKEKKGKVTRKLTDHMHEL